MSLRGERHVWLLALAQALLFLFCCSDFLFPIFSQYPMLDSGGQEIKGKEFLEFIAHLYLWGHVYIK